MQNDSNCHVYGFYTVSRNALAAAILYKEYGEVKFDGSMFNHSGIILEPRKELITPDSVVIESTLKHGGVRFTTLKQVIARSAHCMVTEHDAPITFEQYEKMWQVSSQIEGAGYDLKGVVGLGVGENWQETDKFFCSEAKGFIMKNIGYAGVDWLKYDLSRIMPSDNLSWPQHRIDLEFLKAG